MDSLINCINIDGLKNCVMLQGCEKNNKEFLIQKLDSIKNNLRFNVVECAKSTRDLLESYLKSRYHQYYVENQTNPLFKEFNDDYIKHINPFQILKDIYRRNSCSALDYNSLSIIRIFGNINNHIVKEFDYSRINQKNVLKIFLLLLSHLEQNYEKYFSNIEIISSSSSVPFKNDVAINWCFDNIEKLALKFDDNDIYDFPIDKFEIVKKYHSESNKENLFEPFTYKVKSKDKEEYHYFIPAINSSLLNKRANDANMFIRNVDNSRSFLEYEDTKDCVTFSNDKKDTNKGKIISSNNSYIIYKMRKNTKRLDEYFESNDSFPKDIALKTVFSLTSSLCNKKNYLHHRFLNNETIFVDETIDGLDFKISSFHFAKISKELLQDSKLTVVADYYEELSDHKNIFSISENLSLLNEFKKCYKKNIENELSQIYEKIDVYSLIVLLAFVMNEETRTKGLLNANSFITLSPEFKNIVLKCRKAEKFEEIICLDDFKNYLEKELNIHD